MATNHNPNGGFVMQRPKVTENVRGSAHSMQYVHTDVTPGATLAEHRAQRKQAKTTKQRVMASLLRKG